MRIFAICFRIRQQFFCNIIQEIFFINPFLWRRHYISCWILNYFPPLAHAYSIQNRNALKYLVKNKTRCNAIELNIIKGEMEYARLSTRCAFCSCFQWYALKLFMSTKLEITPDYTRFIQIIYSCIHHSINEY